MYRITYKLTLESKVTEREFEIQCERIQEAQQIWDALMHGLNYIVTSPRPKPKEQQ